MSVKGQGPRDSNRRVSDAEYKKRHKQTFCAHRWEPCNVKTSKDLRCSQCGARVVCRDKESVTLDR